MESEFLNTSEINSIEGFLNALRTPQKLAFAPLRGSEASLRPRRTRPSALSSPVALLGPFPGRFQQRRRSCGPVCRRELHYPESYALSGSEEHPMNIQTFGISGRAHWAKARLPVFCGGHFGSPRGQKAESAESALRRQTEEAREEALSTVTRGGFIVGHIAACGAGLETLVPGPFGTLGCPLSAPACGSGGGGGAAEGPASGKRLSCGPSPPSPHQTLKPPVRGTCSLALSPGRGVQDGEAVVGGVLFPTDSVWSRVEEGYRRRGGYTERLEVGTGVQQLCAFC